MSIQKRRAWSKWRLQSCGLAIVTNVMMAWGLGCAFTSPQGGEVHFNRHIRPILSEHCFACHGPDKNTRKAKLRLDIASDAYAQHESGTPLVPGKPEQSGVFKRIASSDPDERMPPPKAGKELTRDQIE